MAGVTARRTRLRQQAGFSRSERMALELSEKPEKFLSSVQVWITAIGILAGVFGGETIALALQDERLIRQDYVEMLRRWAAVYKSDGQERKAKVLEEKADGILPEGE